MPAFFLVIGAYTAELLNLDPSVWRGPIGIAFAWASTLLNVRGVQNMGAVNQLIVISVIVMMVGIIVVTAPDWVARVRNCAATSSPTTGISAPFGPPA